MIARVLSIRSAAASIEDEEKDDEVERGVEEEGGGRDKAGSGGVGGRALVLSGWAEKWMSLAEEETRARR